MATADQLVYGPVAKSLHWLIFVLLVVQFIIALAMPAIRRDVVPETLINLHMSFGMLVMLVVIFRLLWRLTHLLPRVADSAPAWFQWAARATHGLFYFLLLVLPILGWAAASVRDWQISLFGIVTLPHLLPPKTRIGFMAGDVHTFLSWVLLALIGLHVVAALYHYFVARDRVVQRMLPGSET